MYIDLIICCKCLYKVFTRNLRVSSLLIILLCGVRFLMVYSYYILGYSIPKCFSIPRSSPTRLHNSPSHHFISRALTQLLLNIMADGRASMPLTILSSPHLFITFFGFIYWPIRTYATLHVCRYIILLVNLGLPP